MFQTVKRCSRRLSVLRRLPCASDTLTVRRVSVHGIGSSCNDRRTEIATVDDSSPSVINESPLISSRRKVLIRVSGVVSIGMGSRYVLVDAQRGMCKVSKHDTRQAVRVRVLALNEVMRMTDISAVIDSRNGLLAYVVLVNDSTRLSVALRNYASLDGYP